MFCPKCSRPLAGDVKFCQQCGLALEGARRLLEGGAEAEGGGGARRPRATSARQKGYRQGLKLLLLSLLGISFYPVVEGLLNSLIPSAENTRLDELPLELFAAALFVLFACGLARLLYARLFEGGPAEERGAADVGGAVEEETRPRLFGAFGRRGLPPSRAATVEDFGARGVDTADFARPRSVTEHTTGSLRLD